MEKQYVDGVNTRGLFFSKHKWDVKISGCQLEKYAQCLATAYGLGRILMFHKVPGAFFEPDEYSKYYEPISENCSSSPADNPVVSWQGELFATSCD